MNKRAKTIMKLSDPFLIKSFYGWIDYRDLLNVQKYQGYSSGVKFKDKTLTIYDKHWSDGCCRKVKITLLKEQQ